MDVTWSRHASVGLLLVVFAIEMLTIIAILKYVVVR